MVLIAEGLQIKEQIGMDRALEEFRIEGRGVKTTIPFHRRVLASERFRSGDVSTDFLEQFLAEEASAATVSA